MYLSRSKLILSPPPPPPPPPQKQNNHIYFSLLPNIIFLYTTHL